MVDEISDQLGANSVNNLKGEKTLFVFHHSKNKSKAPVLCFAFFVANFESWLKSPVFLFV